MSTTTDTVAIRPVTRNGGSADLTLVKKWLEADGVIDSDEDLEELFVVVRRNGDGTYHIEPQVGHGVASRSDERDVI